MHHHVTSHTDIARQNQNVNVAWIVKLKVTELKV
jgi:hypothetical protein